MNAFASSEEYLKANSQKNPYILSICALLIAIILPANELNITTAYDEPTLTILDIDAIQAPRRVFKKKLDITDSPIEAVEEVEKSVGTGDSENAVDLAFYPGVIPPKPVGRLKKLYPAEAREQNTEAIVYLELEVASSGRVTGVKVLGTRLLKELPPELDVKLKMEFAATAKKILLGSRFTRPEIEGKYVPVKMELPLRFSLDA